MKTIYLGLFLCLMSVTVSYAQTTIRGKISDENGETLINATVVLKSNKSIGTVSDFDGNYSLNIQLDRADTILISYIGYTTFELPLQPATQQIQIRNVILKPSAQALQEVQVSAKQEKAQTYYMENIRKKSATTIDYVSSHSMKLTGDNNAASAIARVTGVSTNGGFITVRGIGDRYVKTSINGAQIPTLDPFTNNIKLDIIPASLIDNIVVTKTASPDLPGSWTGAYISVDTKDYPDNFSLLFETSVGYNQQTSFKDVLANPGSKTDWLGYDNSYRDHNHADFVKVNIEPSQYEEMCALGLTNYYKALGVNSRWQDGSDAGNNFFKLGLIELGLLGRADFNDAKAFDQAKTEFIKNGLRDKAYSIINESAAKSGMSFPNNWNTFYKKAPLNYSNNFGIGNRITIFNHELGYVIGCRYNSSVVYDPNSISSRVTEIRYDSLGHPFINATNNQDIARYSNGWSALINTAYKFSNNNSLSILFMPNFIGVNSLKDASDPMPSTTYQHSFVKSEFYEQRRQLVYQIKSDNYFPESKLKFHADVSYTNGKSSAPDFKTLRYYSNNETEYLFDKTLSTINRDYRYLSENLLDSKMDFEFLLNDQTGLTRKIKFGTAYQRTDREFNQYDYLLRFNTGTSNRVVDKDFDKYFSLDKFGVKTSSYSGLSSIDLYYQQGSGPSAQTIGFSKIYAAYLLTDYSISSSLRILGGLRVEHAALFSDVALYHQLGYLKNDARRKGQDDVFLVNPAELNQTDFLPSVNLVYKLNRDELSPLNLRLNFSKSIARPSLREFSEVLSRDFELDANVFGNADLKIVEINNYDLRLESYYKSGNNVSLSLFYKDFKNHIELVNIGDTYTWTNAERSRVLGLEFETRLKIVKGLEFRTNISLVDSKTKIIQRVLSILNGVKVWNPLDTIERRMFGQAPYVVNAILSYAPENPSWTFTLSYNYQGPRLILSADRSGTPEVYEMPRHLLDFKMSRSISDHFNLGFTIKDMLNTSIRRSYKYPEGFLVDFDKYNYGVNYIMSLAYKI